VPTWETLKLIERTPSHLPIKGKDYQTSITMPWNAVGFRALLTLAFFGGAPLLAQTATVALMTAGDGSVFLPYGQGVAGFLASKNITIAVKKSAGSNENLSAVDASAMTIATAFMGSAFDAMKGTGWAAGHKHENLRALFPMYETSFQIAALRKSAINSLTGLDDKKVGVGPAKGPAEFFFRAAADAAKIKPLIVNGDPAALITQLIAGNIDALWQGAAVPIASLRAVTDQADAVVFGLTEAETAAMLAAFPQLSATMLPAGSYKGQTATIKSVAAWNFVVANKELPADTAYAITKTVLSAADPKTEIYPAAAQTRAANAVADRFMPFHAGAARFYAETGVKLAVP
jgi:TRAP transporter TAXI family solute receptor